MKQLLSLNVEEYIDRGQNIDMMGNEKVMRSIVGKTEQTKRVSLKWKYILYLVHLVSGVFSMDASQIDVFYNLFIRNR